MRPITRRSAITGTLTLGAGLCLPWKARALTDADRALINVVRRYTAIKRITVHPLFHKHMSIESVDGVKVEVAVFHTAAAAHGNISYYHITNLPTTNGVIGHSYESPDDRIEEWVSLNTYSREFVPLRFPKEGVS